MQHGQRVTQAPVRLLRAAGYTVSLPRNAHLCCGSAGTYNILQPVIATGNVGCAVQIGLHTATPVLHVVELLERATSA